jgi:hypothetical protein
MDMDKYVWHSVLDELPPDGSPLLIFVTERQYRDSNEEIIPEVRTNKICLGHYSPMYKDSAWRDDCYDPIYVDGDFKITHWMFAPDMPEE